MSFLSDRVLDYGLVVLSTEADTLHICSERPATFEQAAETFSIASKTAPKISDPETSETYSGRLVRVGPVNDGSVTGTEVGTFWALVDSATDTLLASGPVADPVLLHAGNLFELAEFTIGIPEA